MSSRLPGWPKSADRSGPPSPSELPPHGRRRRVAGTPCYIPIVNAMHEIVGWTDLAPTVESGRLRHAKAEHALRGPIFCTQVALTRLPDIVRAGGPANWAGPWRCLALCPLDNARGLEQPQVVFDPKTLPGYLRGFSRH
jgi:hypothetical protein